MSCVFARSKYYKQSKADACQVAPPLGYDFLYSNQPKKKLSKNNGQLVFKEVYDKPFHKIISHKKTPIEKVEQFLKTSKDLRKNLYLPPTTQDFMRKQYSRQIFHSIQKCFVPLSKPQYSMIEIAQLIKNPRIQSLLHIEDYALTKFFFLCQGSDPWKMKYLHTFFNRRFIEYPVQCQVINHNNLNQVDFLIPANQNTIFDPPADIENIELVKQTIETINETNKKKDPLYSGVHLYFADFSKVSQMTEYFQREDGHIAYLQYFVTVLTGILGNGQTAILKLCGAFKHKTSQYLFLLKLIFNGKISLCKPITSNPFLPDSYVICEYYNKLNGEIIHKFLLQNYHLLKENQEQQLLLDLKKIIRQDLHNNLKSFNQTLVHKGIEPNLKLYEANSNIQFYPSKERIMEKLPNYAIDLQDIVKEMIKLPEKPFPNQQMVDEKDKNRSSGKAQTTTQNVAPRSGISSIHLFSRNRAPNNPQSSDKKQKPR